MTLIYRFCHNITDISNISKMEPSLKPVYRNNTKTGASLSNQDQTSNDTIAGHDCHSKKRGLFGASLQSIFQEIEEETNEFETNLARLKEEILDKKQKEISYTKKNSSDDYSSNIYFDEPSNNEKQVTEINSVTIKEEKQFENEIEITVQDAITTESKFGPNLLQITEPINLIEASQLKKSQFCEICRKTFQMANNYKWHVHVKNEVHYQCPNCVRIIRDPRSWKKHISHVHEKVKKHQCQICEQKFSEKAKVTRHIQTIHSVLKPFPCDICKKSFGHSFNLKSHISSVHEKVRPFACNFCPYQCSYKIPLEQHIDNCHKKIKKFQCSKCLKSYSGKNNLRDHYDQVHDNLKLITCTTCQDKFSSRHQLYEHRLKMHDHNKVKEISFVCEKCGAKYVDRGGLTRHTNENH